jgi:hypothetical protein
MRHSARRYPVSTLAVAAAALLAVIVPSAARAYTNTGTSFPLIVIDNGTGPQTNPRIDGNVAVYTDAQAARVEYFDFTMGTTSSVPTSAGASDSLPDIDGDTIVFTRVNSSGNSIYRYSIGGGAPSETAPVSSPQRRNPAIGGQTIVWEDIAVSATSDPELVVATGNMAFQLTNDVPADRNPNVSPSGGQIVWEKCTIGAPTLCDVYAAAGGGSSWVTTPVATGAANEIGPDTNGSQMVYASDAGGAYHVYVTTLGGAPVQLVVPGSVSESHPAIAGTFVAFESFDGAQSDIYVYDLTTNALRRITNTPENERFSDIAVSLSGGATTVTVVWQVDEAGTSTNVYASRFQLGAPESLTLSPAADTNPVGTSHTVTATVLDGAGQPVPNVVVRFDISGSVTTSGQCTSGAGGQCSFSYLGPQLPGADLIGGFADTNGNGVQEQCLVALGCGGEPGATATKAWVLPVSTAGEANGGGQIQGSAGQKISFGFHAKSAGGLQGSCNVVEHGGRMVKCLDVTALVLSGNQATIYGNATDDGVATSYVIQGVDNADPGKGADTFLIQTASGYSASGTLTAGNVQVKP